MKLAVFGANGRVGSCLCKLAKEQGHIVLPIDIDTNVEENYDGVDIVIDFSTAEATKQVCDFCLRHHCPLVTGVTGREEYQQEILNHTAKYVQVVESANFSKGIELLDKMCKMLAKENWDCEIVEVHRKQKKDSPSGTAKKIAHTIMTNGTRIVRIHSLRCGSNFGTHQVTFATQGECITVTHVAENVEIFAKGALETARQIVSQNLQKQQKNM